MSLFLQIKHVKLKNITLFNKIAKDGSNRLEVVVPFKANATSLNHKITLTNKIKEIVGYFYLKNIFLSNMQ